MKTKITGGVAFFIYTATGILNKSQSIASRFFILFLIANFLLQINLNGQNLHLSGKVGSAVSPEMEKNLRNTLKKNSLQFQLVENKGQGGLPTSVVAYFSTRNQTVFIEKDMLRVVVIDPNEKKESATVDKNIGPSLPPSGSDKEFIYNSFTIRFKGTDGFKYCEKQHQFNTKRNYLNTQSAASSVIGAGSYGEITLKEIYPGIDLRLYSQENGQLEFDWIVWPGANADLIRMQFDGQRDLSITRMGELQVKLGMGDFKMRLPESYYVMPAGKKVVQANFYLAAKNLIGFKTENKWDNKYPLVIDPDLLWGTFVDGGDSNYDEYLYAVQFNNANQLLYCAGVVNIQIGNAYIATLSGAYEGSFGAMTDAMIYALTKNGESIQYITYLGGSDADLAIGISLSPSFVYICGYTSSSDFPVTLGANGKLPAFDSTYNLNTDGFVAAFNLQLSDLVYCSYLGGGGVDQALTIRAAADSSFYVSLDGTDVLSISDPVYIVNEADNIFDGTSEAWIGKFSSFNNLNFGTYIGGTSADLVNDFQILSDGDIVFAGNTRNIDEVNASIPDNGTGQEALFGRINVPVAGPVSFDIIDKIGGAGSDFAWGIYNLGDSVSVIVGETASSDFPLGTGSSFQPTRHGNIDGFMAKLYNDGSPGYKATYTGGFNDDILVSVRPVVVNNRIALLSFGTTESADLSTRNFNSGTFYNANNTGNHDMMFVICDLDLTTEFYLSYIGGSADDYLGKTGAPFGSNHLFYNNGDSILYLGTTSHSFEYTQAPAFVGRGVSDVANLTVPVFDENKGNGINDTHVVVAISTRSLFFVLPLSYLNFNTSLRPDCNVQLNWKTDNEEKVLRYYVEKSNDGKIFQTAGTVELGQGYYQYVDQEPKSANGKLYYRVRADYLDGTKSYSTIRSVALCEGAAGTVNIYPTVVKDHFTISGLDPAKQKNIIVEVMDEDGKKLMKKRMTANFGAEAVYFDKVPPRATYFVVLTNADNRKIIQTQKIIVNY